MAFDSYSDLQTQVAIHAWRSDDQDFVTAVPGFIALCESKLNKQIRTREMEDVATVAMADGEGDLPADYLQFRSVSFGGRPLDPAEMQWMEDRFQANAGTPRNFAIMGNRIAVYPAADGDLTLGYYGKIPALSPSNAMNWLLERHPEVYLYGALLEAAPFMIDDARLATWGAMYENAMQALVGSDFMSVHARARSRVSGTTP